MAYNDLILNYRAEMSPLPTDITPGGVLAGKIQCVFFDIYGTLFISGSGDISVARNAPVVGAQRHDDNVVLVCAETRLPLFTKQPDDFARDFLDP